MIGYNQEGNLYHNWAYAFSKGLKSLLCTTPHQEEALTL